MARNEEKRLGRLNRLWLQKEREERRVTDPHAPRPNPAAVTSAAAARKSMKSIQTEIQHYLQQSQLSHYTERKINEFHQRIEELETEYKRFLKKLRSLDPTCKHTPWSPRAYSRKRPDPISHQNTPKKLCLHVPSSLSRGEEEVNDVTNPDAAGSQTSQRPTQSFPSSSAGSDPDQDLPLSFDQARLAVAVAGSRVVLPGQQRDTATLTRTLLTGLPNLQTLPLAETRRAAGAQTAQRKDEDVLGLACYSSSSDEEA